MTDALTKVLLRRERILQRVARERDSVVVAFSGLARPITIMERIVGAGRVLRAHPPVAVALVAGVLVLRARSVVGIVGRGFSLWRLFHRLRALIGQFAP